jgi:NAD(P)-dependent dehydrogenase (short-subunit alcohol dehydrogenase family)
MAEEGSQVVLITGAANGIGAATARAAAARGFRVALCDIDAGGAAHAARAIGDRALAVALDVRDPGQWEAAFGTAQRQLGHVDVLINNAGVIETGYFRDVSVEQHRRMIEVNYLGIIHGMKAALPRMKARGHGHIVNVCSMTAFLPMTGMANYAGTKHAIRACHHSVAIEERDGPVTFSIVHPPATETAMLEQELRDNSAGLAFADASVKPEVVAAAILRAIDEKPAEVLMPRWSGQVLRLLGAQPSLTHRLIPRAEARGRAVMRNRRGKLPET